MGLSRKPSKPALSGLRMISSRPKAVTMRTAGVRARAASSLIDRATCRPSMPGIFQSVSTKSKVAP